MAFEMHALAGEVTFAWDPSTASILAGYRLYRGTAPGVYDTSTDVGKVNAYAISGLPDGTYYFAVTAYSTTGYETGFSNEVRVTLSSADTQAPVISGVSASGITPSAATVSWTTDEPADTQVEYGLGTAYGSLTTPSTALVTAHSAQLGGLAPSVTYHYRVRSKDAAGNLATSGDGTFTTPAPPDTTPPVISAVQSSYISGGGATITWATNEPADTQVEYGTTTSYGSSTAVNTTLATLHNQNLTGLAAGTTYHYRVRSKDAAGNLATSGDFRFVTTSLPDLTNGLVAAYPFEEGNGTSTADVSGSANSATIFRASWVERGRFGRALSFDGKNSYVVADTAGLLPDLGTAITIACWIYPSGKPNQTQSVIALANRAKDLGVRQGFRDSRVGVLKSPANWLVAANPPTSKGWHHLAYTFDGIQNSLYIDGALVSNSTIPPDVAPTTALVIGRWITEGEYFKGLLDEVRIYDRALGADEIKMVMNTAIAAPSAASAVVLTMSDQRRSTFEVDPDTGWSSDPDSVPRQATPPGSEPALGIRMSRQVYDPGESVTTSSFWISNPSLHSQMVELKTWLTLPDCSAIPAAKNALHATLELPAGLDKDLGSLPLFDVTSDTPTGTWYLNARMVDTVTGDILAEDVNAFNIGTIQQVSRRSTSASRNLWQDPVSLVEGDFSWSLDDNLNSSPQYTIANRGEAPATVEVKVWLEAPGSSVIHVFSVGEDGSLDLLGGSTITLDPLASSQAAENLPAGTWRLVARVLDWVTGRVLSQMVGELELP